MSDNLEIMTDAEEYNARGEIRASICSLAERLLAGQKKNNTEYAKILLSVRDSACKLDDEAKVSLAGNKEVAPKLIGKISALYAPLTEAFQNKNLREFKACAEEIKYYLNLFDKAERQMLTEKEKNAVREVTMQQSVQSVYDYVGQTLTSAERYFGNTPVNDALVNWQSELSSLSGCDGQTAVKCLKQLVDSVKLLRALCVAGQGNSNRAKDAVLEGNKIMSALYECERKTDKAADIFSVAALKKAVAENDEFGVEAYFRDSLDAYEVARRESVSEIKTMELSTDERLKNYDREIQKYNEAIDGAFDDGNSEKVSYFETLLEQEKNDRRNTEKDCLANLRIKHNFKKIFDTVLDGAKYAFEYASAEEKLEYMKLLGAPAEIRQKMASVDDHTLEAFIILIEDKKRDAFEYSENIRRRMSKERNYAVDKDDLPKKKEATLNDFSADTLERQIKRGKITLEECAALSKDKIDVLKKRGALPLDFGQIKKEEEKLTEKGAGDTIRSLTDDILSGK